MKLAQLFAAGVANRLYMSPEPDLESGGGGGGKPAGEEGGGDEGKPSGKPSDREAELLKESMKRKEKISDLSSQNEQLSSTVNELQESLKRFEGVDPDKFQELIRESEERREKELEGAEDWNGLKSKLVDDFEAQKSQMVEQHQGKLGEVEQSYQSQIEELTGKLNSTNSIIEELTIGSSFANSQFIGEKLVPSASKVQKLYGDHFDVVDGKVHSFDKPRGSESRQLLVDDAGKPLAFEKALVKIVDSDPDKDSILRASVKGGADSDTENRPAQNSVSQGVGRIRSSLGSSS